jgi:flagellin
MGGLYINHNMMALTASRNLGISYSKLSTSINKLSSGLRINSAADDAAGLAVRELMRSDITVLNQGQRNANDAISMLQTMDGAAGVIDEKLIRMKELAEQAATGTYNDTQRAIMQGEFDQMRQEIGRIAQATDFNGVKMLNLSSAGTAGTLSAAGDVNAFADTAAVNSAFTSLTTNATQVLSAAANVNAFADTANVTSAFTDFTTNATQVLSSAGNANAFGGSTSFNTAFTGFASGDTITVTFTDHDGATSTGSLTLGSGTTITNVVSSFNSILSGVGTATWTSGTGLTIVDASSGASSLATSFGNGTATVVFGTDQTGTSGSITVNYTDHDGVAHTCALTLVSGETIADFTTDLNSLSSFGATVTWTSGTGLTVLDSSSGVSELAISFSDGTDTVSFGTAQAGASGALSVNFTTHDGTVATCAVTLVSGATVADLISDLNGITDLDVTAAWTSGTGVTLTDNTGGTSELAASLTQGSNTYAFSTATEGVDGSVKIHFGPGNDSSEDYYYINRQDMTGTGLGINTLDISTQEGAQNALTTLDSAILTKDQARAHFGAMMNRLSNTVSNLSIQAENVQAAESQISDVDVATEMTKFVNSQIKAQAAVAMLSQANTLPQMALSLIGG